MDCIQYLEHNGIITFRIASNDKGWILQCRNYVPSKPFDVLFDVALSKTGTLEPWEYIEFASKWGLSWFEGIESQEDLSERIKIVKEGGWDFVEFEEIYRMLYREFGTNTLFRLKIEEIFCKVLEDKCPKGGMSVDELLFGE